MNYTLVETARTSSCFGNVSSADIPEIRKQAAYELNFIYKFYQGLLPLPLAVIGLILSSIYFIAVLNAVRHRRISRKCYGLLLNRSFGDCFGCLMAILISAYLLIVPVVSRELVQFVDGLFMSTLWSAMVSYVALSFIKLYAVWQPLAYRNRVTMRRCVYLIVLSWLVFVGFAAYSMIVIGLTRVPMLNAWSHCKNETCVRTMYRVRNAVVVFVYLLTIFAFVLTVILIRRARRFMRDNHRKTTRQLEEENATKRRSLKDRFPLWKLSVNVGTFAVFNCLYPIFAGTLLVIASHPCFFLNHFNTMMIYLGIVRISLLLRIVIDPIIAFITDVQVRRSILTLFGLQKRVVPVDSKKRPFFGRQQTTTTTADSTSDSDIKRMPSQATTNTNASNISSLYIPDRASVHSSQHATRKVSMNVDA